MTNAPSIPIVDPDHKLVRTDYDIHNAVEQWCYDPILQKRHMAILANGMFPV